MPQNIEDKILNGDAGSEQLTESYRISKEIADYNFYWADYESIVIWKPNPSFVIGQSIESYLFGNWDILIIKEEQQELIKENALESIDPSWSFNISAFLNGTWGIIGGVVKVYVGLEIVAASGGAAVFSGGSAAPAAVIGVLAGGTLVANGFIEASIGLAVVIGSFVTDKNNDFHNDVPSNLGQVIGIVGDAFVTVATKEASYVLQDVGEYIGKFPMTTFDVFMET